MNDDSESVPEAGSPGPPFPDRVPLAEVVGPKPLTAGPAWAIVGGYLIAQTVFGVAAAFVAALVHVLAGGDDRPEALQQAIMPWAVFGALLAGIPATLLLSHYLVRRRSEQTYRQAIGWEAGPSFGLLAGAAVGLALAALYVMIPWHAEPAGGEQGGPLTRMAMDSGVGLVVWTLLALGIPVFEEFLFRGVFYAGLARLALSARSARRRRPSAPRPHRR